MSFTLFSLLVAARGHAGALHYFDAPFASLIDIVEHPMTPEPPESALAAAQFGPFVITPADTASTLTAQGSGASLLVAGGVEIDLPDGDLGVIVGTGPQLLRVRAYDASDALLFDETAAGNVLGREPAAGKLLVLSATPIARLRIDPADDEPTWRLSTLWSVMPDEIGPSYEGDDQEPVGSWPTISFEATTIGAPGATLEADGLIPDPATGDILYALASDGSLLRSDDGGVAWRALPAPWSAVDDIVIHPTASQHLWVLDGGTLWQSADRGESWRDSGLANIEAIDVVEDARTGPFIFGVYFLTDAAPYRIETAFYAAAGGTLFVSEDLGETYRDVGTLPGALRTLEVYDGELFSAQAADGTMLRSTDRGATWAADPAWGELRPDTIVFTPCGDLAQVGDRLHARPNAAGVRAPALEVLAPPIDLERSSTYGCEVLLATAEGWWRFHGFEVVLFPGICFNFEPFCTPESLVFDPLGVPLDSFPVRRSARLGGPFAFLPDDDFIQLADGRVERLALPAGDPGPDIDRFTFTAGERGFYPVEIVLPAGNDEGFWGATVLSELGGGINMGAALPADGAAPGFLAFALLVDGPADVRVFEYTGAVAELEVRLLRQEGETRIPVGEPILLASGEATRFEALPRNALHILEIRSAPGDPEGRFAIELLAAALRDGASFGGTITRDAIGGFFGVFLDQGSTLVLDMVFGRNYGPGGAGPVVPEILADRGEPVAGGPARLSFDGRNQRISSFETSAGLDFASDEIVTLDQTVAHVTTLPANRLNVSVPEPDERVVASQGASALLATSIVRRPLHLDGAASTEISRLRYFSFSGAFFDPPPHVFPLEPPTPVLSLPGRLPRVLTDNRLGLITLDGIGQGRDPATGRITSDFVAYAYDGVAGAWSVLGQRVDQPIVASPTRDRRFVFVATSSPDGRGVDMTRINATTGVGDTRTLPVAIDDETFADTTGLAAASGDEAILSVASYSGPSYAAGVPVEIRLYRFRMARPVLEDLGPGDAPLVSPDGSAILFERPALAFPEPRRIVGGRQLFWQRLDRSEPIAVAPPLTDLTSRQLNDDTVLFVSSDELAPFDTNADDVYLWRPPGDER